MVGLIFRKFEELLTVHGLLRYLVGRRHRIGVRVRRRGKGEIRVARPNQTTLQNMLQKPDLRRSLRLRAGG